MSSENISSSLEDAVLPPTKSLKIFQCNLNHYRLANTEARKFLDSEQIDIALLQDAYTRKESDSDPSIILLPDFQDCRYFKSSNNSDHVVILNPTLITDHIFTGENCVLVTIFTAEGEIILGNTYIKPSIEDFDLEIESWRHVITQTKPFVCSGDFNTCSTL